MVRDNGRLSLVDIRLKRFAQAVDVLVQKRLPGFDTQVASGFRSMAHQDALYAQGRLPLKDVNAMRAKVPSLYPIPEEANRATVTNAKPGQSSHNYGCAIDLAPYDIKATALDYKQKEFWKIVGEVVAASKGELTWGADWNRNGLTTDEKFVDSPHVEITDWLAVKAGTKSIQKA